MNNIYAYIDDAIVYYDDTTQNGHENVFTDNKVVLTGDNVGEIICTHPGKTIIKDNEYFTPNGTIEECGMPLHKWQEKNDNNDPGSSVHKHPSDATIIEWAKIKLLIG